MNELATKLFGPEDFLAIDSAIPELPKGLPNTELPLSPDTGRTADAHDSGKLPISRWRLKAEVADHFRCDVRTITNLMSRRVLPFVKIGRFVRFDLTECDLAMKKYERRSGLC
jgi:hypothetical protein